MPLDRNTAVAKLEQIVSQRRSSVEGVLASIEREQPKDSLVPWGAMTFNCDRDAGGIPLVLQHPGGTFGIHDHALRQSAERAGIPWRYVNDLREQDHHDLIAHYLNYLFKTLPGRSLVREVNGTVRGVLSDAYRRRDSRPLADALVRAANEVGGVPIDARRTDVRTSLRVIRPEVIDIDGDFVVAGLAWNNSDYGAGANSLSAFLMRLVCINGAVVEKLLRKVHLGARLDDLAFSDATYRLDQAAQVSATRDMVKFALAPAAAEKLVEKVRAAKAVEVDPKKAVVELRKVATKGEAEEIAKLYTSADIEMLPQGNNAWRWSNAISRFANTLADHGRAMELDAVAGAVLQKAA